MLQLKSEDSLLEKFPLAGWRLLVFCSIQAFDWLVEAHPQYREQSALLEVQQFKYKSHLNISSQKYYL